VVAWVYSVTYPYYLLVYYPTPGTSGINSFANKPTWLGQRGLTTGIRFLAEAGIFHVSTASGPALGPIQPHIQLVPGDLSLEIKRLGREADHPPPSRAVVENAWK